MIGGTIGLNNLAVEDPMKWDVDGLGRASKYNLRNQVYVPVPFPAKQLINEIEVAHTISYSGSLVAVNPTVVIIFLSL